MPVRTRTPPRLIPPPGWHLNQDHMPLDEEPITAFLPGFGPSQSHFGAELAPSRRQPFCCSPKIESRLGIRIGIQAMIFFRTA